MGQSLAVVEKRLSTDVMPRVANILLSTPDIPAAAFMGAFMESVARNPKLLECTEQSLMLSASTFGCYGVLPGPFLGQGWLIPRRLKGTLMCVPQLGYKGLCTIAGRGGRTIESDVIRAKDKYRIIQGSEPMIHVEPNLVETDSAIIAAWSVQEFQGRRVSPMVVPVQQLLDIKNKNSKAANKDDAEGSGFSPWADPKIGFPAMCQKTVVLRQRRALPMGMFHFAGAIEDLQDQGRVGWVVPSERTGHPTIITEEGHEITPPPPEGGQEELPPELQRVEFTVVVGIKNGVPELRTGASIERWKEFFLRVIAKTPPEAIAALRQANGAKIFELANAGYTDETAEVSRALAEREQQK